MSKFKLIFLLIIIGGSLLRLYRIDLKMRFIWDEARDMLAIHHMIVERDLTLFGPYNEIDGKIDFFGVFHYYLMAPALTMADFDPLGPAVFTALLGIASIYLLYWISSKYFPKSTSLLITAIYAFSPLVVKYAQWPWNPNSTPFFALLFFISLYQLDKTKELKWSAIAGLLLGLLFQLHYFTIALAISWIMILNVSLSTNNWKSKLNHTTLFAILFALPNLSFIIFDFTHDHFYWKILSQTLAGGTAQQYLAPTLNSVLTQPLVYSTNIFSGLFATPKWMSLILSFGFFIWIGKTLLRKKSNIFSWVAVTYIGILILAILFPKTIDDYHSNYVWFSLIFFVVKVLQKIFKLVVKQIFTVGITVGLLTHLLIANNLFRQPTWMENMPLTRDLSRAIATDLQTIPTADSNKLNIVSLTDSDTRATKYRYFITKAEIKLDGIDQQDKADILYIISPHTEEISKQNPAWEIQNFVSKPWDVIFEQSGISVFRVSNVKSISEPQ